MHRLTRRDIQIIFSVALATADRIALKRFRSNSRLEREQGQDALAAILAAKVDNDSSMVIVTEPIGEPIHRRPGKWGVDEPAPAETPGSATSQGVHSSGETDRPG